MSIYDYKILNNSIYFSLSLISTVQAADVTLPEQLVPVVFASAFSWTGFYLRGQIGIFSSKMGAIYLADENTGKWSPVKKEFLPKLSGCVGGICAGSNIDSDNGLMVGIETDMM